MMRRLSSLNEPHNNAMRLFLPAIAMCILTLGCSSPGIHLFPDESQPLREFTLQGKADDKILLVSVSGAISDKKKAGLFSSKPSMLQEFVSQLRKAEEDEGIKAILLKINSPGGTVTASDIIYNELMRFKKKTGAKITVAMMGVATSGGYYISLPADYIMAHPTTITGSVGAIFLRPELSGLMDKLGVEVSLNKTGKNKDMGSWFREPSREEDSIFQDLIGDMGDRFLGLVKKHRNLTPSALEEVATARVFVAADALRAGLVDGIGYIDDALKQTIEIASLPKDTQLVVYRRTHYPNDNFYNSTLNDYSGGKISIIDLGQLNAVAGMEPGFYYMWPAIAGH
jgi:protease-4